MAKRRTGLEGKRYMGPPCGQGHNGERYVTNQQCCACALERNRAHRREKKPANPNHRRVVHLRPEQVNGLLSAAAEPSNRVPPLVDFRGER